jgi:hypothetical protein
MPGAYLRRRANARSVSKEKGECPEYRKRPPEYRTSNISSLSLGSEK